MEKPNQNKTPKLVDDFIPLSDISDIGSNHNKSFNFRNNKNNRTPTNGSFRSNTKSPVISGDHQLYDRTLKILKDKPNANIDSIANELQNTYPEYRRKKKWALGNLVQTAINTIDKNRRVNNKNDDDDDADESMEVDADRPGSNRMNNSINNLYSMDKSKLKDGSKGRQSETMEPKSKKPKMSSEDRANKEIEAALAKQTQLREKYLTTPKVSFDDFGGVAEVIGDIKRLMFHIRHPELYRQFGVEATRGFLLHGPPGVGKSLLVEALAGDLQIPYLRCGATEIVAGISGESEEKIRELFSLAKSLKPCLLFIDEIDAITPKRENAAREMERRIVTQLITSLDELSARDGSGEGVMVIGATNRPDSLDPALRRAGRFDREITLGIPDERARLDILRVLSRDIKLVENFDLERLAHRTPGYVGADLKSLVREAAISALERFLAVHNIDASKANDGDSEKLVELMQSNSDFRITMVDFEVALKKVQPSSKREGFATVPDVTWDDIGALSTVRQELQMSILAPVRYSIDVQRLGLTLSVGILLCGPPGCGKTLLAKAIANESGINFISVKGPELLNMYVGESERAVRAVFSRARNSKPCVIFFDEIDALCPKRNDSAESSNVSSRVVNQLLTEMDGLESRDCFLLAATNRPDIVDPAILRPGRFDKILYVGFPSPDDRYEILWKLTKNGTKPPVAPGVDLRALSHDSRLDGFTGADLSSLVREASLEVLRQKINGEIPTDQEIVLDQTHFEKALNKVKPSVSVADRKRYLRMLDVYSNS